MLHLVVFCFVLILLSASVFAFGERVRVGVYENPPKIFTNEKGEISGFYADLIKAIAQREGWNIEFVHGTWEDGLKMVETGEIDFMVDVAFSEARAKLFDFNNETIFVSWASIYSNKNVEIQSFRDLNHKRVATMQNSILTTGQEGIIELAKSFDVNVSFIMVEDYKKVFELVERGSADAGAVNNIFGEVYSKSYNLKKTPIMFQPAQLKFAFPKNSSSTHFFIERIDANLREMKSNQNSAYYAAMKDIVKS